MIQFIISVTEVEWKWSQVRHVTRDFRTISSELHFKSGWIFNWHSLPSPSMFNLFTLHLLWKTFSFFNAIALTFNSRITNRSRVKPWKEPTASETHMTDTHHYHLYNLGGPAFPSVRLSELTGSWLVDCTCVGSSGASSDPLGRWRRGDTEDSLALRGVLNRALHGACLSTAQFHCQTLQLAARWLSHCLH